MSRHVLMVHGLAAPAAERIAQALARQGLAVERLEAPQASAAEVTAAAGRMAAEGRAPGVLIGHGPAGTAVLAAAGELPSVLAVATLSAPFEPALEEAVGHLRRPLLVLHSPRDEVVDIGNATRIFVAARHPKSFISLDPADHALSDPADAEVAAAMLAAWAARAAPAAKAEAPDDEHVLVRETGGGRYQVEVLAAGQAFLADEPQAVGGLGSGPTPYQLLAAGLGACTAMTLRMYANQKGWPVTRISSRLAHSRRKDQTPADLFTREITIEGELDAAQHARLLEIADRCPVHRTLSAVTAIETVETGVEPQLPAAEPPEQHERDMEAACKDC